MIRNIAEGKNKNKNKRQSPNGIFGGKIIPLSSLHKGLQTLFKRGSVNPECGSTRIGVDGIYSGVKS